MVRGESGYAHLEAESAGKDGAHKDVVAAEQAVVDCVGDLHARSDGVAAGRFCSSVRGQPPAGRGRRTAIVDTVDANGGLGGGRDGGYGGDGSGVESAVEMEAFGKLRGGIVGRCMIGSAGRISDNHRPHFVRTLNKNHTISNHVVQRQVLM